MTNYELLSYMVHTGNKDHKVFSLTLRAYKETEVRLDSLIDKARVEIFEKYLKLITPLKAWWKFW